MMGYSSKPNPNARTYPIDYDEMKEIMELTDMMFPTAFKSTSGNLTNARNNGSSLQPSLNKVAIEQVTSEVHALVNKYNEEIVNGVNSLKSQSKNDTLRGWTIVPWGNDKWNYRIIKNGSDTIEALYGVPKGF